MSDVVTDVPDAPFEPVPAPTVVYPTSSPAGLQSFRNWFGGKR